MSFSMDQRLALFGWWENDGGWRQPVYHRDGFANFSGLAGDFMIIVGQSFAFASKHWLGRLPAYDVQVVLGDGNQDIRIGPGARANIDGGDGNDRLSVGVRDEGRDRFDFNGGDGFDEVSYARSESPVHANLLNGLIHRWYQIDTVSNVEAVTGSRHADTLIGNHEGNHLAGGAGDDDLFGHGGNDILSGDGGKNRVFAHDGDDHIYFSDGGITPDTQVIWSGLDQFALASAIGGDQAYGGAGNDSFYLFEDDPQSANDINYDADEAWGGDDDDTFFAEVSRDLLRGGRDHDTLDYSHFKSLTPGSTKGVFVSFYDDRVFARDEVDIGTGRDGDTRSDFFASIETFIGSALDDVIQAHFEFDDVRGGEGSDTLIGGHWNDFLVGDGGGDRLLGNNGADSLFGGTGLDLLNGGAGNDLMYGGANADSFYFARAENYLSSENTWIGHDTIADFEVGTDTITFERQPGLNDFHDLNIETVAFQLPFWSGGYWGVPRYVETVITTDDPNFGSITLRGVAASELDASDFWFV